MLITRNWLQEWINISAFSTDELCKTLNSIGLEVDSVTSYKMPENCVVGYVVSKEKHPNADKLSVCQVDVGMGTPLQIVCGAPNVDVKQYIAVALDGAILPGNLKIEKTILRNVESNGMICSTTELGLPKINDGIVVLNSLGYKVGTPLSEVVEFNDDVIEIELTANRGDCLSIYGVARDLSAALRLRVKKLETLTNDVTQIGIGRVLNLCVENGVNSSLEYKVINPSSFEENLNVELRVSLLGVEPKTPLEKFIAYATHATGVILRAYNADIFQKTKDNKINIVVKKEENQFDVVCSEDILSYIGISQDKKSKATNEDKTVAIEASYVDPDYISSYGVKNIKDADSTLYRSSRGSEPNLSLGLAYLENLLKSSSKTAILNDSQKHSKEKGLKKLKIDFDDIFSIIGKEIDKNEIVDILNRLDFKTLLYTEQNAIWVDIPPFRHDIANMQDICEEVVRIVGIDNIPSKPLEFSEKNRTNDAMNNFQKRKLYRHKAASAGFYECVHYVFDDRKRIEQYGFACIAKEKDVANPITTELNTLRVNLCLNLLESLAKNVNTNKKSISLFEIGRVFDKNREERTNIAFVTCGFSQEPNVLNHGKPEEFSFFIFAQKARQVIGDFEIRKAKPETTLFSPFEYGEIVINDEVVGTIGRVNIENSFELEKAYVCELNFEKLPYARKTASAYSKLPSVSRDLSLLVSKEINFSQIRECIKNCNIKELSSFYAIDIYSDETLKENISLTISFNFQPNEKSFSDKEINEMIEKILKNLEEKLKITIR
ncbi:MAG: phenylalanine--tRNA ligase subunit beta [Campylobacteraceae bacterium]|jgi:phenylalanyl-tRNA synthetase beta chain|nr:phenylalanine--tRNA ligase subunit beta [Campylobacteraceae bacterium]